VTVSIGNQTITLYIDVYLSGDVSLFVLQKRSSCSKLT